MRSQRVLVAACAVGLAALSACGSGSDSEGEGGGDFPLSKPIHITQLVDISGETPFAVDDYNNGMKLAVADINKAGGLGGQKVEFERLRGPNDPQGSMQAVQKAGETNPDVIIGLNTSTGLRAALPAISEVGVPFLTYAYSGLSADEVKTSGKWLIQPSLPADSGPLIDNGVAYLKDELGVKKIGVMGVDTELGNVGLKNALKAIKGSGGSVVAERTYKVDANDLTEQVLAMKGSDAILNIPYPNPLAVQLNQALQNGMDVPTMSFGSNASIVVNNKLASSAAIAKLYASTTCNPADKSPEWAKRYEAEFGAPPTSGAGESYDATMLAAAAIDQAKSSNPDAIMKAFGSISFTDGVCLPKYEMDGDAQIMGHGGDIVFYGDGVAKTVFQSKE